jgi:hypothetical protein
MSFQTVAERVAEKVDDVLKAEVIHWAAFYVSPNVNYAFFQFECVRIFRRFECGWGVKKFIISRHGW